MKKILIAAFLIKAALARFTYGQEAATILTDFAIRLDGGNAVASGGSSGTVTSADMTVPTGFTISGGPITTTGTFALGLSTQTASKVFIGPVNGGAAAAPTFRLLQPNDLIAGCSDGNVLTTATTGTTFSCTAPPAVNTDVIFDAKGDLAVGTANNTAVKLTVGTNDKFLVADSTQTTGLGYRVLKPADLVSGCSDGNVFTQLSAAAFTCVAPPTVSTDPVWDAKGDLAGGTGNNTAVKLTVGANDTALVADSAQTTGMKWQTHTLNLDTLGGTRGMLLLRGASAWAGLAKGTAGQVLKSDGTDPGWHDVNEPQSYYNFVDDFNGYSGSGTSAGADYVWAANVTNSATMLMDGATLVDGNHPGIMSMSLATTSATATISLQKQNVGTIIAGGEVYETLVNLNVLSDGTNRYLTRIGYCDIAGATGACVDGLYFEYTDSVNSGQWQIIAARSTVRTTTNTTIAVTAAAWHKLKIVVNAAATSVEYFVDGVSAGTITGGNLPTTAAAFTGLQYQMVKSVGTSVACMLSIDYVRFFKPVTR